MRQRWRRTQDIDQSFAQFGLACLAGWYQHSQRWSRAAQTEQMSSGRRCGRNGQDEAMYLMQIAGDGGAKPRISSVGSRRSGTITVIIPAEDADRTPLRESSRAKH